MPGRTLPSCTPPLRYGSRFLGARGRVRAINKLDRRPEMDGFYDLAMPDFADDTGTELERKARALSWTAFAESVTYTILFTFWIIVPNTAGKAITGSVHGMVWLAFCAMTIMITKEMKWSWKYTITVIVLGPIGGLMVWARIRRDGVPSAGRSPAAALS